MENEFRNARDEFLQVAMNVSEDERLGLDETRSARCLKILKETLLDASMFENRAKGGGGFDLIKFVKLTNKAKGFYAEWERSHPDSYDKENSFDESDKNKTVGDGQKGVLTKKSALKQYDEMMGMFDMFLDDTITNLSELKIDNETIFGLLDKYLNWDIVVQINNDIMKTKTLSDEEIKRISKEFQEYIDWSREVLETQIDYANPFYEALPFVIQNKENREREM